jgi:hypothetical protein
MTFVRIVIFITAVFVQNFQYEHEMGKLWVSSGFAYFVSEFMGFHEMMY